MPRMFEQELLVFDPLVFASVAIGKPASAKPPTAQMLVLAYGVFETYVPPTKSAEQVALEMEALSDRFLQTVMEVEQDQLQGAEGLSLDALQRNARQLFRMFDQDKSDSIDFEEYKQMLAYMKVNLLESKAKRFFRLVDDQNKGYIDEREFVIAMYITNYLRAQQKLQRDDTNTTNSMQTLSPIDVFHQLDGDRDELLNAFEYEKALELLGVSLKTKRARKVARAKLPKSTTISLNSSNMHGEAEKRVTHEREVVQELMESKMERIIRRKARYGDDIVDLRGRCLKAFPHDLYHGRMHSHRCRSLDISSNELTGLPEEIGEARDLQLLDARSNRLATTPKGLANLHELRVLHLAFNQLSNFGDNCLGLRSLEELNLASNMLEVLADDIGEYLVKLVRLNLRGNPTLKRLPNSLQQLRDLSIWDLSACDQKRLGRDVFGPQLQSLRSLNLSFNALSTLPDGVGAIPKLQELNFKSNTLGSLPSATTTRFSGFPLAVESIGLY
ncbi:hypothetical protein PInf_003327 [Phytophthora infestans]|nr:hypothetical protein PInf_003327 [Phytophthora infestans]